MDIEDARRIFRKFELPRDGFDDVLMKLGRLERAATDAQSTRQARLTLSKASKAKGSRAA